MSLRRYDDRVDAQMLGTLVRQSLRADGSTGERLRLVRQFIMDVDRLDASELAAHLAAHLSAAPV